jgi:hypothetical protein
MHERIDCLLGEWSPWSPCTEACGPFPAASRSRSRKPVKLPAYGGNPCKAVFARAPCAPGDKIFEEAKQKLTTTTGSSNAGDQAGDLAGAAVFLGQGKTGRRLADNAASDAKWWDLDSAKQQKIASTAEVGGGYTKVAKYGTSMVLAYRTHGYTSSCPEQCTGGQQWAVCPERRCPRRCDDPGSDHCPEWKYKGPFGFPVSGLWTPSS